MILAFANNHVELFRNLWGDGLPKPIVPRRMEQQSSGQLSTCQLRGSVEVRAYRLFCSLGTISNCALKAHITSGQGDTCGLNGGAGQAEVPGAL